MQVTSAAASTSANAANDWSQLQNTSISSSTFLTLLTAELQNQDPLSPMETQDMLTQISQISTVSELSSLNDNFQAMAESKDIAQMAGLIGRTVQWEDSDGNAFSGTVSCLEVNSGGVQLKIGEALISPDDVTAVK